MERVEGIEATTRTIPTEGPESDGTFEWQETTLVLARVRAGDETGLGYTYADASVAGLIEQFMDKLYGPELVQAFREFKAIWDPDGRMNPGKVVDPYRIDENLKLGVSYHPPDPDVHFHYPEDGGSFAHAALRCVGAGKCRDTSAGTMCPSYMATLDEEHTTRGRARVLFEMLRGETISGGWRSDAVHEALDLCLS